MAYTSDMRVKNLLKDLHIEIISELKNLEIDKKLYLRIFDESREDSRLWEDGGLTFSDVTTGLKYGSNDCAWFVIKDKKKIPLVVVEGTYGTERGQFGDGQHNRFSHPLGPVKKGYIGVLLCPFTGESYSKDKGLTECYPKFACMKFAYIRKTIVKAAVEATKKEKGDYYTIDSYDTESLKKLVIYELLNFYGLDITEEFSDIKEKIKKKMSSYVINYDFGSRSLQLLERFYNEREKEVKDGIGRIFTHNYDALTTATKRDGHGLFGKNLIQYYLTEKEHIYCLFVRLTKDDIEKLKKRQSKEFKFISEDPHYSIISIDDMKFLNKNLEQRLRNITNQNLHTSSEKSLIKEIKMAFGNGEILVTIKKKE